MSSAFLSELGGVTVDKMWALGMASAGVTCRPTLASLGQLDGKAPSRGHQTC